MNNPLSYFSHCSLPSTFVGQTSSKRKATSTQTTVYQSISHSFQQALDQNPKDKFNSKELSFILVKHFQNFQTQLTEENPSKKRKFSNEVEHSPIHAETKVDFDSLVLSSIKSIQKSSSPAKTEHQPVSNHHSNPTGNSVAHGNQATAPKKPKDKPNKPSLTKELENGKQVYKLNGMVLEFKVPKKSAKTIAFEQAWRNHFDKLVEFKNKHGHTNVTRCTQGYEELGGWVSEQRRKLKNGKVTMQQFETLNEIGFEWDRSYYFHNTYKPNSESDLRSLDNSPRQEQPAHIGVEALLDLSVSPQLNPPFVTSSWK